MPAILSALTIFLVSKLDGIGTASIAFLAGSLILGFGLGWLRAKTVRLTLDPANGRIIAQSSAAAIIFLVGLFAVRSLVRWAVKSGAVSLPLSAQTFDVVFLAFAAALFLARTMELAIRARRLRAGAST